MRPWAVRHGRRRDCSDHWEKWLQMRPALGAPRLNNLGNIPALRCPELTAVAETTTMRLRVCLPLLLLALAPIPASADVIGTTFEGLLGGGSSACARAADEDCPRSAAMLSLELALDGSRHPIADGFNWATGRPASGGSAFLPLYEGMRGPVFQPGTDRLPGGFPSFELRPVSQLGLSDSLSNGTSNAQSATPAVYSIPDAGSLILTLAGGAVAFVLLRLKRVRTSIS